MTVLIIGGDNLGNIPGKLYKKGYDRIEHVDGRKGWDKKIGIVSMLDKADLVIVFVDFLSHNIARSTKEKLRNLDINAIYTRRSWSYLENQIEKLHIN